VLRAPASLGTTLARSGWFRHGRRAPGSTSVGLLPSRWSRRALRARLETTRTVLWTAPTASAADRLPCALMPFTYMLRCSDGSYYVGSTWDLDARLAQHAAGEGAQYTRHRLPVELVWAQETDSIADAFAWEKQLQGWSRAKREALIRGDWKLLPWLSKRGRKTTDTQ
jgi:putative endonuclease